MKKTRMAVSILIVLLGLSLTFGQARETEGQRRMVIGSVSTAGNRVISSAEILSKVRSRAGDFFDVATAAEDAERIARLSGVEYSYYNTAEVDGRIRLTFVIVERNIVRSITFVGNRSFKSKVLRKKVDFKRGDYLDPMLAETGSEALSEYYRKKGFPFVQVSLDERQLEKGKLIYTIDEGPRVRVASIQFIGNESIKSRALKKAMKTRRSRWFVLPAYYNEQRVDEDAASLQNIYYRKGFLDAGVTAEREFSDDKSRVRIKFAVREGRVYSVERIELAGNDYFDDGRLRAELQLQGGQIYSQRKADRDARALLKLYREAGFIDATVEPGRRFIAENKVNVKFGIIEGQRFRIGAINITGNEQTQDKVIRRVLDEYDFVPGNWYNADIARGDGSGYLERQIRRMALTETTITPGGQIRGQRDAQVSVVEGQTGMVLLGAGVASDSGAIGQLILEQRNFDITDTPESFKEFITGRAFKGAGQNFRIALQPGTEVSEYSVSFSEPYFRNKPVSLDLSGSSWERERESYDEQRGKGFLGFEKRYRSRWYRSIGFRLEDVSLDSIDFDAPKEVKDDEGSNLLAGVKLGFGRDLTDDRLNPTSGYSFGASYEQVGGDHSFGILKGTGQWYRTVHEDLAERKTVLATKLLGATVVGDAPVFEKFYGGGSGTYGIRGFDYRGVSTRGINSVTGKTGDPIGSDWIFLASSELIVPLVSDNFSGLFFVDGGVIDSGGYRVSVGTGIQILIPQWFGPVPMRLEVAAPIMKDDDDDMQVFSFSIGRLF